MTLLFDHNLSPRLIKLVGDLYQGSIHVRDVALHAADDQAVWDYAIQRGLTIVSKDSDFHQRSFLLGPPPKVVWVRRGNCTTDEIALLLRHHFDDLQTFARDEQAAFLALG